MSSTPSRRLPSVDWLRGFVLIVMALDHVRQHFMPPYLDPLAPAAPTAAYITRWITHICAPAFILLAGVSAGLAAKPRTPSQRTRLLITRGLWLVLLDATVVTFAWKFHFDGEPYVHLQVLYAIGVAMIVLAGLSHLPRALVVSAGMGLIVLSSILQSSLPPLHPMPGLDPFWASVEQQLSFVLTPTLTWCGLMACGYGLAGIFDWDPMRRRAFLYRLSGALLIAFLAARSTGLYGESMPFVITDTWSLTLRSFLDVTRYPPSLHYLALMLALVLPLPALVERRRPPVHDAVVTIGRVPLFFYVVHLYAIHLLALVVGVLKGFPASAWLAPYWEMPDGFGFGLPVVWLAWIGVVLALYPACRWFARVKAQRND